MPPSNCCRLQSCRWFTYIEAGKSTRTHKVNFKRINCGKRCSIQIEHFNFLKKCLVQFLTLLCDSQILVGVGFLHLLLCLFASQQHLLLVQVPVTRLDFCCIGPNSSVSPIISPFHGFPQIGLPNTSVVALGQIPLHYLPCTWPGVPPLPPQIQVSK